MIFWSITIANIVWILYSISEGVREGFFTHYKNQCKRNSEYKCSNIFYLQRIIVLLTTSSILISGLGLLYSIPFILGQISMFNFFHKISLKQTYKKINSEDIKDDKEKLYKPLVISGIALQVFVYIFML
jgi:hypothetical protein